MEPLKFKRCIPCEGGVEPLTSEQIVDYQKETPEWAVSPNNTAISRSFAFDDFAQALVFASKIGAIAQEEWHHPDMRVRWGRVDVSLQTHAIKGLSENDFIMAAKIDAL